MPVLTECAYMRAGDLLVERLKRAEALATTDLELDRLTRTSEGSILSYIWYSLLCGYHFTDMVFSIDNIIKWRLEDISNCDNVLIFFNQLPSTMADTSPTVSLHSTICMHMQLVRMCKMYMYPYAVVHYVSLFIGYRCCPCISHPRDLTLFLIWYKAGID